MPDYKITFIKNRKIQNRVLFDVKRIENSIRDFRELHNEYGRITKIEEQ